MRLDVKEITEIISITEGMLQRPNQAIWKQRGHEHDFINYLITIACINSLEPYTKVLNGEPLEDYEIFVPFANLLVPNKITVDGSMDGINLLNMSKYSFNVNDWKGDGLKVLTPQEFKKFSFGLCAAFRLDKSQQTATIMNYRKDVLLADVINRGVSDVNGTVKEVSCFPLFLNVVGYEAYSYQYKVMNSFARALDDILKPL